MQDEKIILVMPETNGSKLRDSDDPKFIGDMIRNKNDTPYITKK